MNINKINLDNLISEKKDFFVELNKDFLNSMLKKASKCEKPHRDRKFCKNLGVSFNETIKASPTIITWIRLNRSIPLSKIILINKYSKIPLKKIESNIISIKAGFKGGKTDFNFPIRIDKRLGSIIGHILGDGSIDKKYQQVFYSNSNKELLREFSTNMQEIFGITPRIWMQRTSNFEGKTRWDKRINVINELKKNRSGGLFYPSVCGYLLNIIFENFAIGFNKKITNNIVNSPKEFKIGLLRAFYDDEGTVGKKSIRLFQDRKDILENMRWFLIELNILPGEIKMYIKKGKEHYYFDIHRKSNFVKFRDKIGFTSSKKISKLQEICIIRNQKNSR